MRRFDIVVTCVCCALLGYFGWHAYKGPRGFPYRDNLVMKVASLKNKYEDMQARREKLESKVSLLRPESIDPDLLDELARGNLELAKPTDVVAFTSRQISE
ncbi:MAG: septum formation initiator family protein [Aestuariivirga sp.]|uniref:FtsB family cell division protein n=1 Tax=Aestuariivirga sp. TaxID=2650926 RepID=UPI0025B858D0|nr:septum formation initiator family protein [Aestuariivirga sp.]MCA3560943.1 septum formation initiator family protein [Aestuariivirga sp.]